MTDAEPTAPASAVHPAVAWRFEDHLEGLKGREFWSGLEELAGTEAFRNYLRERFPRETQGAALSFDRRRFFTLMGASLAMAGLAGCRFLPQDHLIPYVNKPEELVPGLPLYFTTAMTMGGYGVGLIAESHEGRPTKLEGNPNHPSSLGGTTLFHQAATLGLYDPDRSATVTNGGDVSTWDGVLGFVASLRAALDKQGSKRGAGIRIVTESTTSPTTIRLMGELLKRYPDARWIQWEAVNRDAVHGGARMAFGEAVHPVYHLDKADVVLALDSDFMFAMPGSLRYARDWADRRRVRRDNSAMNRLYAVESAVTVTGAAADNRLAVRACDVEGYARALAAALGVGVSAGAASVPAAWVQSVAADLKAHGKTALVIAGEHQPAAVHALAHAMNAALGSIGTTVDLVQPVEAGNGAQLDDLRALVADISGQRVDVLLFLGGNPLYSAPADLRFGDALKAGQVPFSAHLGLEEDETSQACQWHVPQAHFLECWTDCRGHDGTATIAQPLIQPLFDGRSIDEFVAAMLSEIGTSYDLVRATWKARHPGAGFDAWWERCLLDGTVPGTAAPTRPVSLAAALAASLGPAPTPGASGVEVNFRPDSTVWDGRFNNNPWLQELPKPLQRLSWDNTATMSPNTAAALGLGNDQNAVLDFNAATGNERVVELTYKGRTLKAPVLVIPGHPDGSVCVQLGYGRPNSGRVGTDIGYDAGALRTSDHPWFDVGLTVKPTDERHFLAISQYHHNIEHRHIIDVRNLDEFKANPEGESESELPMEPDVIDNAPSDGVVASKVRQKPLTMYEQKEHVYDGYAWGMSVDLTTCIGCNACVQACQAENNIPVVGKDQVMRGRDMHWLRLDTYYRGSNYRKPEGTYFMPVMCMQCEQAPCEVVCPVGATVHSKEGLNQMVYNRCVGTKYCSNNCPYKVRRFNFYKYAAAQPDNTPGNYDIPIIQLSANPNVTIRGRGVMEKCTFCVQRINAARIQSKKEDRLIRDGEIVTACQQACPTKTIVFGDISDKSSHVSKLKAEPHDYSLLLELGTRPRLTYLAKIKNPNPDLVVEA